MLIATDRRVGVFIDVQNMYYSARNIFNRKVNFPNIVKDVVGPGKLIRAIAYTVATPDGAETPFFDALRKNGIEVMAKDLQEFEGGNKKGDWDVGLTIDVVRMIDMLDVVVVVSGDGDFIPLADYVRGRGRIFHTASFRESTSSALIESVDVYTNLSADKKRFLLPERGDERDEGEKPARAPRRKAQPKQEKVETGYSGDDAMFLEEHGDAEPMEKMEEGRSKRLSF